jgi:hypothetical protein
MTDSEIVAAIRKLLADAPAATDSLWFVASGPTPTVPITDLSNESELKRYAAHGLKANLVRMVQTESLPNYAAVAKRMKAATTPEAAETIIKGASNYPTDVAIYVMFIGGVQGTGPLETPSFFAPASIQTIRQAAAWSMGVVLPGDPGMGT